MSNNLKLIIIHSIFILYYIPPVLCLVKPIPVLIPRLSAGAQLVAVVEVSVVTQGLRDDDGDAVMMTHGDDSRVLVVTS